jgi:protoheme IX farnesyltransferase
MFRTKNRALPAEHISPPAALFTSIILVIPGVLLAVGINLLCGLAVLSGVVIDLLLYTVLLKRKTPLSVSIGGIAGGMPTLAGYVARSGRIDFLSVSLVLLIALWSMAHIWLIASYYVEDYRRASIPMLPAVVGARKGVVASIGVILLINGVVLGMCLAGNCALWAFPGSLLLSLPAVYFACGYLRTHRRGDIRKAYISLSPYLGLMMTLLLLLRL